MGLFKGLKTAVKIVLSHGGVKESLSVFLRQNQKWNVERRNKESECR